MEIDKFVIILCIIIKKYPKIYMHNIKCVQFTLYFILMHQDQNKKSRRISKIKRRIGIS